MTIGHPDAAVGVEEHPASAEPVRASSVAHGKSPTRIALDRLRKDKVAMVCAAIVALFVLVAIFAPLLAKLEGQDPAPCTTWSTSTASRRSARPASTGSASSPGWARPVRPLGVRRPPVADRRLHRDARHDVVGVVMGLIAGFLGGWVDRVLSWVIDFVLSLPYLLFAIALVPIVVDAAAAFNVHARGTGVDPVLSR